ncbi:MAG: hypothetical protein INR65_05825 [Gluconacetobacter diazotrophicus]|nr:hypothetical protein [Gluconacetobacter diazotrophicus]
MTGMRRQALAGVLYAEDFDEPPRGGGPVGVDRPAGTQAPDQPAATAIRIEPTFSLVELQRAVEHALEEERSSERSREEQAASRQREETLARIAAALERTEAEAARIAEEVAAAAAGAVMAALAALLPELSARHGAAEVALLARQLLPLVAGERRLVIRAGGAALFDLRDEMAPLLRDGTAAVEWVAVEAMGPPDLSVSWDHGTATRDGTTLLRNVMGLILPEPRTTANETGGRHGE